MLILRSSLPLRQLWIWPCHSLLLLKRKEVAGLHLGAIARP